MTPQHPHPLRCDISCTNYEMVHPFTDCGGWRICKKTGREITPQQQIIFADVGCASHSAGQQRIDAVIKILDEIEAFMKKKVKLTTLQWNDVEVYFQKKKALLRGDPK